MIAERRMVRLRLNGFHGAFEEVDLVLVVSDEGRIMAKRREGRRGRSAGELLELLPELAGVLSRVEGVACPFPLAFLVMFDLK